MDRMHASALVELFEAEYIYPLVKNNGMNIFLMYSLLRCCLINMNIIDFDDAFIFEILFLGRILLFTYRKI